MQGLQQQELQQLTRIAMVADRDRDSVKAERDVGRNK